MSSRADHQLIDVVSTTETNAESLALRLGHANLTGLTTSDAVLDAIAIDIAATQASLTRLIFNLVSPPEMRWPTSLTSNYNSVYPRFAIAQILNQQASWPQFKVQRMKLD